MRITVNEKQKTVTLGTTVYPATFETDKVVINTKNKQFVQDVSDLEKNTCEYKFGNLDYPFFIYGIEGEIYVLEGYFEDANGYTIEIFYTNFKLN